MFKALFLAASVALVPQAMAICFAGDLAIGVNVTDGTSTATLWDSNCDVLDFKSGSDVCGSYDEGATVICNAGVNTPASAQLGNGLDFGDCERIFETNCNIVGEVEYCCSPAPPPSA